MKGLRLQGTRSHALTDEGSHTQMVNEHHASQASATDRFMEATGEDLAQRYRESGLSGHDFATLIGGAVTGRYTHNNANQAGDSLAPDALALGLQGQLQDRFHLGEGRSREIASDLSQKISKDHGFQSELARSVALDAAEGHRQSGSLGLRSDAMGEMGRSAQAAVEAESLAQTSLQTAHRSGTEVRIGALEAGQRLIDLPESLRALHHALDSVGLRGDAQRLGGEWHHQGLIHDPRQAEAAAGLALLSGHAHPVYHALSEEESVLAKTLGRTVLGEAFQAPYVENDVAPHRGQPWTPSLPDGAQLRETIQTELPHNPLEDRNQVMASSQTLRRQSQDAVTHGDQKLAQAAEEAFTAKALSERQGEARWDAARRDTLSPSLDHAARASSAAESIDTVTGAFLRASYGRLKVLGDSGIEAVSTLLHEAASRGASPSETLRQLFEASPGAVEAELHRWIDGEVNQVRGDLTPTQLRYYKSALLESFAGYPLTGDYQTSAGELGAARKALDEEAGGKGPVMATLLRKIAADGRRDLLGLIKNYNGRKSD